MKIYNHADLEKRSFEGRTSTTLKLKFFLNKKGFIFVDNPREAEVIHFHSSGILDTWKAAKLKKLFQKPVIYSLYSVAMTEPFDHLLNHFLQLHYFGKRKTNFWLSYSAVIPLKWRAKKLKEIDYAVTPSKFVKSKLFPNTKLIRVGIDINKFKPVPRKKNDKLKVAFFGHPSVYKGMLDFARASKYFSNNIEVYIFPSRKTKKIENSLRKINPSINIMDFVEDMVEAYNSMDVIVAPHRSKLGSIANPLVILEAMSCGKAVVTTNLAFIKELVGDAAIIVNSKSPKEITKAVEKLQDANFLEELGKKARFRILEEFSEEKMFSDYLELYGSLK
jgi:glycosyltransferase involved in cell wall biosynthesis